jgi:hypothetical protein
MFSETTKQIMFVSGVGLLHGVTMFLCLVGTLGTHRLSLAWRAFCIVAATLFHLVFWLGLVMNDDGLSLDGATCLLVGIDAAALLVWRWYDRRPVLHQG